MHDGAPVVSSCFGNSQKGFSTMHLEPHVICGLNDLLKPLPLSFIWKEGYFGGSYLSALSIGGICLMVALLFIAIGAARMKFAIALCPSEEQTWGVQVRD